MMIASPDARSRAAVLIGYVRWLRANSYYELVAKRVRPELRALMEEPPIRTAWISGRDIEDLMHALEQVSTSAECRRLGVEVTRDSVLPTIRPIIEAALRRTHASPATIYQRLDVMMRMVVPDQSVTYRAIDQSSGEVVIGWPYTPHEATLEVWAGALEVALELCGRTGEVRILAQPDARRARFAVSWR
ncbi:MAG: hypothetical protein M3Y87_12355 [Myxococcota bacterium]|nr:hypothetical protein [Myxococcota bacterium]